MWRAAVWMSCARGGGPRSPGLLRREEDSRTRRMRGEGGGGRAGRGQGIGTGARGAAEGKEERGSALHESRWHERDDKRGKCGRGRREAERRRSRQDEADVFVCIRCQRAPPRCRMSSGSRPQQRRAGIKVRCPPRYTRLQPQKGAGNRDAIRGEGWTVKRRAIRGI